MNHPTSLRAAALALTASVALAGCATVAETLGTEYTANLTGAQEVPGSGDIDGRGDAEIVVDAATPQICYDLNVDAIGTPTAAHIHRGAVGVSGPPVVTLEVPWDEDAQECVSVPRELAAEIIANPMNFYVNVHNAEFPNGAIRGQLR